MHPVIRVLAFLSLVALLSRATLAFILLLDMLFLVFSFRYLTALAVTIYRSVIRLRWLWLSLMLLYVFMPPTDDTQYWLGWLPVSASGLLLGLERCLALLTVILYFSLLNHLTGRSELQAAIYWLLAPLQKIGVPVAQLSLRISLTFAAVTQLQQQKEQGTGSEKRPAGDWRQLPQRIFALFEHALTQAQQQDKAHTISLNVTPPPARQWLYLLLFVASLVTCLRLLSA